MTSLFVLGRLVLFVYLLIATCLSHPYKQQIIKQWRTVVYANSLTWSQTNERPIIGIMSQEYPDSLSSFAPVGVQSYIAASYVKFIESAGARVVPILINQGDDYYEKMFYSVNGILLPGGSVDLGESGYGKAAYQLYEKAIKANNNGDFFPIWGTCLGLELLTFFSTGRQNWLTNCGAEDRLMVLDMQTEANESRMFAKASPALMEIYATQAVAPNFHHFCMTPENMTRSGLDNFYKTLALDTDDNGLTFVAVVEGINYPFYGVQFHPEKNAFEWTTEVNLTHTAEAIQAGNYFASFLVNEARKSSHKFASITEEEDALIFNFDPVYTTNGTRFEQSYFFA